MRKLILLFIVVTAGMSTGYGQQDPQFSMNMYNRLFPNPGVAGANGAICATMLGREQWVGFEGHPATYLFTVHGPVKLLHGGLGLSVARDELGPFTEFHLKGSYAYRMQLGPGEIGAGLAIGLLNKTLIADWDPTTPEDPRIPTGIASSAFDMDLGVYYSTDDLYAGISSTHIPSADLQGTGGGGGGAGVGGASLRIARHYYLMAGYSYDKLVQGVTFEPSVFVKSDGATAQIDINISAVYNNLLWGGITYRLQDAVVPMVGVDYQMGGEGVAGGVLRIGYSYDVTTSHIRTVSSGSHEILLNYCFNIPKTVKITRHKSVRYL